MKWPWVSRARYDLLQHNAEQITATLKAALAVSDGRYDQLLEKYGDLTDKYHDLRVAGANPALPTVAIPRKEPDVVTQAIIAKSRGSAVLRKQFADLAAQRRAEDVSEPEIAKEILAGVADDLGVP